MRRPAIVDLRACVGLWTLLALAACAETLPPEPATRALVRDLTRVVDVRQKVGWVVDDVEVEAVLPDAMMSACRAAPATRAAGLAWLDDQIALKGGPPEAAWLRAGKELGQIEDLLLLSRSRLVLSRADAWAGAGKCPFWLEATPAFDGVQVVARRWILTALTGGRFIVGRENGINGFGGGGGARLLVGYGLNERTSLHLGVEGGGGARFTKVPIGERATVPDFLALFAIPLVARRSFGTSAFAEAELGFMTYLNNVEGRVEPGFRAGLAVGGYYVRLKRGLLPHFSFAITFDHAPGGGDAKTISQISAGFRAGFDFTR